MGSTNSSSTLATLDQNIKNNSEQFGSAVSSQLCKIGGVELVSEHCSVKIDQQCFSDVGVTSDQIFSSAASATMDSETEQSASMIAFMSSNDSNTEQHLTQNFETNVSNSCNAINNSQAIVENIRLYITKCPPAGVTFSNFQNSKTACVLSQTSNIVTDADLTSGTTQKTSLFGGGSGSGSFGDSGASDSAFVVLFVIAIFVVALLLLLRRRKKKKKDSK